MLASPDGNKIAHFLSAYNIGILHNIWVLFLCNITLILGVQKRGKQMIILKIDVIQALKNKGYTPQKIRQEKIFGQRILTEFRQGKPTLGKDTLNTLCRLLECDVGDILQYIPDDITPPDKQA